MHNAWFETPKHGDKPIFFRPVPGTKGQDLTLSKTYLNTPVVINGKKYPSICELCINRYACWSAKKPNPNKCQNWLASPICQSCTSYNFCYKPSQSQCHSMSTVKYPGFSGFVLDRKLSLVFDNNPWLKDSFDLGMKIGIKNRVITWLLGKIYKKDSDLYETWTVTKKSGGKRVITEPRPELKTVQKHILERIIPEIGNHHCAYGFIPGRNIVQNASRHANQKAVVSIDIKDFFPSIRFPRIYGVLKSLNFHDRVAGVITALCTWNGSLPQGAPTSPALSNLIAFRMDKKLSSYCYNQGWTYTRYADDLTFSTSKDNQVNRPVDHFVSVVRRIVEDEGFEVNEKKIKIMRDHKRQWVTGLVANEKTSVIRWKYRQLRAAVHNAATIGLNEAAKKQGISRGKYVMWVDGNLAFHNMVDPRRIETLSREWEGVK